jgi:hypothetical protein
MFQSVVRTRTTLEDYQRAIRRLPDAALGDFSPSPDAAESVRRYLDSLAAGIGDPRLPLLTEGSRIFRAVVARNGEQLQRIHEFFVSAGAYQLVFAHDLGLAVAGPSKSREGDGVSSRGASFVTVVQARLPGTRSRGLLLEPAHGVVSARLSPRRDASAIRDSK